MTRRYVKVYPRFERFYHWGQALLIFVLFFTGLGVAGLHALVPYGLAVTVHTIAAVLLLVLWVFATFWHFTTGDWLHYLPTTKGLFNVARYYAYGVFRGEEHPFNKRFWAKNNPLQALTYVFLKAVLFPAIWITGILYLTYSFWDHVAAANLWLGWVAVIHALAAFTLAAFVIVHVYLLTLGHTFRDHVRPMITGYDIVDLSPEEEAYLAHDQMKRLGPVAGGHH